jgi:hypothetical protein
MPVSLRQNTLACSISRHSALPMLIGLQSGVSPGLSKSGCTLFAGTSLLATSYVESSRGIVLGRHCWHTAFFADSVTCRVGFIRSANKCSFLPQPSPAESLCLRDLSTCSNLFRSIPLLILLRSSFVNGVIGDFWAGCFCFLFDDSRISVVSDAVGHWTLSCTSTWSLVRYSWT